MKTVSAEHLEIFSNYVRVLNRRGEEVTKNHLVNFITTHFPEYRDQDQSFLKGIASYILL